MHSEINRLRGRRNERASLLNEMPSPDPWKNRGVWCFSITGVPAKCRPLTHNAFAEIVDAAGNYLGRELGPFRSRSLAEAAVERFESAKPAATKG